MPDIKIVEFKSNGKEYCAVSGIPEESENFTMNQRWLTWDIPGLVEEFGRLLPGGNWQILGRLNDLSKEQCADMCLLVDNEKPGVYSVGLDTETCTFTAEAAVYRKVKSTTALILIKH